MVRTAEWFTNSKGYGLIGRKNGSNVFVHYIAIMGGGYRTLQEVGTCQLQDRERAASVQCHEGRRKQVSKVS